MLFTGSVDPESLALSSRVTPQPSKLTAKDLEEGPLGSRELEALVAELVTFLSQEGKGWANIPVRTFLDWGRPLNNDAEIRDMVTLRASQMASLIQDGWLIIRPKQHAVCFTAQLLDVITLHIKRRV